MYMITKAIIVGGHPQSPDYNDNNKDNNISGKIPNRIILTIFHLPIILLPQILLYQKNKYRVIFTGTYHLPIIQNMSLFKKNKAFIQA